MERNVQATGSIVERVVLLNQTFGFLKEESMSEQLTKPLSRLQAYLVAIKTCLSLFREVCVEFKDVLVIITVILFFIIGVYESVSRLLH